MHTNNINIIFDFISDAQNNFEPLYIVLDHNFHFLNHKLEDFLPSKNYYPFSLLSFHFFHFYNGYYPNNSNYYYLIFNFYLNLIYY